MKSLIELVLASRLTVGTLAAGKVELLRGDFWVAHIYASTTAGAAFAFGYAQAEDRLEELMRNYGKPEDGKMEEL